MIITDEDLKSILSELEATPNNDKLPEEYEELVKSVAGIQILKNRAIISTFKMLVDDPTKVLLSNMQCSFIMGYVLGRRQALKELLNEYSV